MPHHYENRPNIGAHSYRRRLKELQNLADTQAARIELYQRQLVEAEAALGRERSARALSERSLKLAISALQEELRIERAKMVQVPLIGDVS